MSKKAATPAFQAVPYQNVPLNDDTWRAFIYVLLADCDEHIPSILTPLFSHIGTGYRQRFSVLSKQDLITWALENVKTYDLCKEAKGFVDSSQTDPDIPDHLMGRLLKLKLWALKQEGIDARNVAKQAKEQAEQAPNTTEVIEAPKNGKPGKKEEKDKEKAKQTPQKKATKGGSKAAEVPSRPESAQAAVEISKRKIKLRERKNKADAKPASIGDEPEDGPDAYYVLRDFNVPGVINALMEENDISINAVVIVPCCDISISNSPNYSRRGRDFRLSKYRSQSVASVREFALLSSEESLWKQVAWCEIPKPQSLDPKELFDAIAYQLYEVLSETNTFNSLYTNENVIHIPNYEESGHGRYDLKVFETILGECSCPPVEALLGLLEELVTKFSAEADLDPAMSDNSPVLDDLGHVTMHLNSFIERMPLAGPVREKIRDKSSHLIKHGDTYALTVFVLDSLAMYGINSNEMLQTIFDIQPSLLSRLQKHQKALPPPELDYLDFYMKKFGKANLDQFLVQAEFEEMLGCDVEKWNLDSWCWVERFEKATLTQVINNARCTNPCVAARISTLNSQRLLVALHNHGKVSDRRTIVSNGVRIKTKVNFGLFHDLDKVQRAFIQPFSQDVPSVYMAGDQIVQHMDEVSVLYSSWGSNIQVHNINSMYAGTDLYTVLNCYGDTFVWGNEELSRDGAYLTATFETGLVLSVHPSSDTASVQISIPTGLTIELRADGTVSQKIIKPREISTTRSIEINRVIQPDGVVMRFFTGDTVEILQPNGSTSKRVNGSWTSTSIDGKRLTTTSTGEITSTSPIRSMKETHISLGRIIESREDAVSLTLTRDGEAIADHADRTRIVSRFAGDAGPVDARVSPWTTMKPKSVVVSGEGFGSVTMDFEKGVEIKFPNGATLRRVVKEEDGTRSFKFRMEQNNSTLEFSSTGKAIFRPNKASSETYNLNWVTGEFLIVDDESYEITVSREGKAEGRYLQNIKSPGPAPVPHLPPTTVLDFLRSSKCLKSPSPPNPPRLFVVEEDGTGFELLRDEDVWRHMQRHALMKMTQEVGEDEVVEVSMVNYIEKRVGVEAMVVRQIKRYPPMTNDVRHTISSLISEKRASSAQ